MTPTEKIKRALAEYDEAAKWAEEDDGMGDVGGNDVLAGAAHFMARILRGEA